MTQTNDQLAEGTFEISMSPADPLLEGSGRFGFTKKWKGDLAGDGEGVMLSAGDPGTGKAGYVALETFQGVLAGRSGGFSFVQLGLMAGGEPVLDYVVVPGSGSGELANLTGSLELEVTEAGEHRYRLSYAL